MRHFESPTATYENVLGLLLPENRHYLQKLIVDLQDLKYQIEMSVLDASDFGDPQKRKRVFLFFAKETMHLPQVPQSTHVEGPGLLPKRTVGDAIE